MNTIIIIIIIIISILILYYNRVNKVTKYYSLVSKFKIHLPLINKKIIYTQLLIILLSAIALFFYFWFSNIKEQVYMFFNVDYESFVHYLVIVFFGSLSIISGVFLVLFFMDNKFIKELISNDDILQESGFLFKNQITLFSAFLILVYFGHTSKYFNNYYGLSLSDEEGIDRKYDYVAEKYSYEVADDFYSNNNNLFSNHQSKSRNLQLTEHLFFKKEFILKETGQIQGYHYYDYKNKGFWNYIKSLIFALVEIIYRAFLFFVFLSLLLNLIQVISSFILKKDGKEDSKKEALYGGLAALLFSLFLVKTIIPIIIKTVDNIVSWF